MSSLIVQIRTITNIRPHKNPEKTRIEIAEIDGWQSIIPKGQYAVGDNVVFIPPDSVMTKEISDKLGVTNYLKNGRVTSIKLGGEMSFGIIVKPDQNWPVGTDVAEHYQITKYEPPIVTRNGNCPPGTAPQNPRFFHKFTDIENIRHFKTVLDGHEVICLEKIHGANWRACLGYNENGTKEFVVGSRNTVRKVPTKKISVLPCNKLHALYLKLRRFVGFEKMEEVFDINAARKDWYHHVLCNQAEFGNVQKMIEDISRHTGAMNVALYGETFGDGIQNMTYGKTNGQMGFVAFALAVDYKYVDYDVFINWCVMYDIPTAPLVYRGPYLFDTIRSLSSGKSLIKDANHIREGVVVLPTKEMHGPSGRIIFKSINDDYLLSKESGKISDSTDS